MAIGDPTALTAYREALAVADPVLQHTLRARLARAAVMSGDLDTAEATLDGLEPNGGPADAEILLAHGHLAFLRSDFETAWAVAEEAQRRVLAGDRSWQVLDLASLQGLLAHHRGEWFDRMLMALRRTRDHPGDRQRRVRRAPLRRRVRALRPDAVPRGHRHRRLAPGHRAAQWRAAGRRLRQRADRRSVAAVGRPRAGRRRAAGGHRPPPRPGLSDRGGPLAAAAGRGAAGRG